MPHGLTRQRLILALAFVAGMVLAGSGKTQPVTGGPATGGNDATGGNVTGGSPAGGNDATGGNTTGGSVNPGANVGVNLGEERRYIVEFDNFVVLDETGCDYCGSDEASFVIRTADYSLHSSQYGNLDSPSFFYDTPIPHRFKRCAVPAVDGDNDADREWECDQKGKTPPFSFTIAAYEFDPIGGNSDCLSDLIHRGADGRYTDLYPPDYIFCAEQRDELIGKIKIEIKSDDLAMLQSPGDEVRKEVDLVGGCDSTKIDTCGDDAPLYRLRYAIRRVPDAAGGGVLVNPNP